MQLNILPSLFPQAFACTHHSVIYIHLCVIGFLMYKPSGGH